MTPRHGNTFHTTDPLWGEFTIHWWIVPQNASGAKCDVSFDVKQTHIVSSSMGKPSLTLLHLGLTIVWYNNPLTTVLLIAFKLIDFSGWFCASFPHGSRDLAQTQQTMADRKHIGRAIVSLGRPGPATIWNIYLQEQCGAVITRSIFSKFITVDTQ